jgi:hypothetical protein
MMNNDTENTFIFIDLPILGSLRNIHIIINFGENSRVKLFDTFKSMNFAKVMIIINKDEFTYDFI